jgi:hypothetical protein
MRAIWRRRGNALAPSSEEACAMFRSMEENQAALGDLSLPNERSLRQLKLWWALMQVLVEQDKFPIKEAASDATKIACGHCDVYILPDTGEVRFMPKSIAFDKLRGPAFNEIFNAAIHVICERWLGNEPEELREEVFRMVDGDVMASLGVRVR